MKRVIYRGGIVTFQIPATWREEYEPDGGGTFYEAGTDTGTLRLHILSLEKAGPLSLKAAAGEVFGGEPVETLPNGSQPNVGQAASLPNDRCATMSVVEGRPIRGVRRLP